MAKDVNAEKVEKRGQEFSPARVMRLLAIYLTVQTTRKEGEGLLHSYSQQTFPEGWAQTLMLAHTRYR